ncbi:MAG TPA: hypothetical protein VFY17_03840, partial [Pilimelia sp.]|nr:hypothetical protein [Pilimelia sp.]
AAGAGLDLAVRARQRDRLADLLAHARGLGLAGADVADYLYLTERVRRWPVAADVPATVLPFLAPAVVLAGFALAPGLKRTRRLHAAVVARCVPAWSGVPYSAGAPTAGRVWRGDGAAVVRGLLRRPAGGGLSGLVQQAAVRRELARRWRRSAADHATRQYVHLALSQELLCPPAPPRRDGAGPDRTRGGPAPPACPPPARR